MNAADASLAGGVLENAQVYEILIVADGLDGNLLMRASPRTVADHAQQIGTALRCAGFTHVNLIVDGQRYSFA